MTVLNRRITVERKTTAKDATMGSQTVTWSVLDVIWAERRDSLPSRSEAMRGGLEQARDQVRYRVRWRADIDSSMRVRDDGQTLQIVGSPAEIGRREYIEFTAERIKPAGT
jgi:SPP1 family predicted phage head-tail adaptor